MFMNMDYFKAPFGAQLLIWTSRIICYGSCRTKPNKYDFVDKAYNKVGIKEGSNLLKPFINMLRISKNFHIQPLCERYLIESEIDLIQCVNSFKSHDSIKKYFINLWDLESNIEQFIFHGSNLGRAFREANLNTDINQEDLNFNSISNVNNLPISTTFH